MKFREYRLQFERVPKGEEAVDPEAYGLRSKFGGEPDWVQEDETPSCPHCSARMSFVGQLDSIEHDSPQNPHAVGCLSGDQQYLFGDVGMIYIFFCRECSESRSVLQF